MLPCIVHQVWLGGLEKSPRQLMRSWQAMCRTHGWQYKLWTEAEIDHFGLENRGLYEFLRARRDLHGMSDLVRIEVLNRFGGFYCDCDFAWTGTDPAHILTLNADLLQATTENVCPTPVRYCMWQRPFTLTGASAHFLANGIFACPPRNKILSLMIESIPESFERNRERILNGFINAEGARRHVGSADYMGCFLLTLCSRQFPFILVPKKSLFGPVEVLTERFKEHRKTVFCCYFGQWRKLVGEALQLIPQ